MGSWGAGGVFLTLAKLNDMKRNSQLISRDLNLPFTIDSQRSLYFLECFWTLLGYLCISCSNDDVRGEWSCWW